MKTAQELEQMLKEPFDIGDFAGMGDRVAAFAALGRNIMEDTSIDRTPFLRLFEASFPWWYMDHQAQNLTTSPFIPWEATETNNETDPSTGMVICVGTKNLQFATHLIMNLKNVIGSELPIEIFYAGENDLPAENRTFLASLNPDMTFNNLLNYFDDSIAGLSEGGFAMKPFALLASSFQRALLVDADVIFLSKPDSLFQLHPDLKRTGTLFYHDRAYRVSYGTDSGSRRDWIKNIVITSQQSKYITRNRPSISLTTSLFWRNDLWQEMESGVVAYDKARIGAWFSLVFAAWMNSKEIREEVTWQHFYGDKETYWMAAELSGTEYSFQEDYAGAIGAKEVSPFWKNEQGRLCGTHLAHAIEPGSDTPFWFNGGLVVNKAQERLGGLKLHKFEDWVPGSNIMDQQPNWWYKGNDVWCAQGRVVSLKVDDKENSKQILDSAMETKPMVNKKAAIAGTIKDIMEQAKRAEVFFEYGNWTGPAETTESIVT